MKCVYLYLYTAFIKHTVFNNNETIHHRPESDVL
uniref:Uncharacterized protein n=1 Tax=Anguilla anguilla TaxID=7936 RepID=A0A0E9S1X9_ANGAN